MKKGLLFLALLISVNVNAQFQSKNLHLKSFLVQNDTVKIDSVSITPFNFKVFTKNKIEIDSSEYNINFAQALLVFKKNLLIGYRSKEFIIELGFPLFSVFWVVISA